MCKFLSLFYDYIIFPALIKHMTENNPFVHSFVSFYLHFLKQTTNSL